MELDKLFIPIHIGENHWCMACINFVQKRFEYYDALGGSNATCLQYLRRYVADTHSEAQKCVADEAKNCSGNQYDFADWEDVSPRDIPRQQNGCDCGVFALKYADYLSEDAPMDFTQRDMPYFRNRICLEIAQGALKD
jgi:sentrin-specific protease 1